MKIIQINSSCWNTSDSRMLFLKPDIFYPDVPVKDLHSKPIQEAMDAANDQYEAYLQSVKPKIIKKLWKLFEGKVLGLTSCDTRLHDFIVKRIVYDGIASYGAGKTDQIRMILDARNDYEYELIFDRVLKFNCRNDIHARYDLFRGMEEIVLCEIGIIEDITGCNFLNFWTSSGCELSVWFQKFDLQIIKKSVAKS